MRWVKALQLLAYLAPVWLWLAIMTLRPHKEERFLFVVYPLVCLSAAVALASLLSVIKFFLELHAPVRLRSSVPVASVVLGALLVCSIFVVLSGSRIYGSVHNYGAPLQVYSHLHDSILQHKLPETTHASDGTST